MTEENSTERSREEINSGNVMSDNQELEDRAAERSWMVEKQLIPHGIKDQAVIKSMLTVPRHRFVAKEMEQYAYYNEPLKIGEGQTISQPLIVALMAQALNLSITDRVLEIGTGSGYSAAVLSRIVAEVYTVERHESLAEKAVKRFQELNYTKIHVHVGDGTKGWPEESPFDGIIVTAGGPIIPQTLCDQLAVGGRLVMPVGNRGEQELICVHRNQNGEFSKESLGLVRFVPLIGTEGWPDPIKH